MPSDAPASAPSPWIGFHASSPALSPSSSFPGSRRQCHPQSWGGRRRWVSVGLMGWASCCCCHFFWRCQGLNRGLLLRTWGPPCSVFFETCYIFLYLSAVNCCSKDVRPSTPASDTLLCLQTFNPCFAGNLLMLGFSRDTKWYASCADSQFCSYPVPSLPSNCTLCSQPRCMTRFMDSPLTGEVFWSGSCRGLCKKGKMTNQGDGGSVKSCKAYQRVWGQRSVRRGCRSCCCLAYIREMGAAAW